MEMIKINLLKAYLDLSDHTVLYSTMEKKIYFYTDYKMLYTYYMCQ